MLNCLILGDSIAVGVGRICKECVTYAKNGINSSDYVNSYILHAKENIEAKTIIISLGSNDLESIDTFTELDSLRQLVKADRVYWILPNIKEEKRKQIWMVANKYKDSVIDARQHDCSADQIHPTYNGYKTIAEEIK